MTTNATIPRYIDSTLANMLINNSRKKTPTLRSATAAPKMLIGL
jgi:hypothetical protein